VQHDVREVVEIGGSMELTRKEVVRCWARIDFWRNETSFISPAG
jgi:hypothetical protein